MDTPKRVSTVGIMNMETKTKVCPTEWLIVPLPDQVQVKEEGFTVFQEKGKLYRFDTETKQWKERATGQIKIEKLLNDKDKFVYRLLGMREKVQKVGCNQLITASMDLKPMPNTWPMVGVSKTSWCWFNTDFSEDLDGNVHQFAIKFPTESLATEFKSKVSECQADFGNEWTTIKSKKKSCNDTAEDYNRNENDMGKVHMSGDLLSDQVDPCGTSLLPPSLL